MSILYQFIEENFNQYDFNPQPTKCWKGKMLGEFIQLDFNAMDNYQLPLEITMTFFCDDIMPHTQHYDLSMRFGDMDQSGNLR